MFSGKLTIRISEALHRDVAQAAQEEGVSMNQFVAMVLAKALGGRAEQAGQLRGEDAVAEMWRNIGR